MSIPAKNFSVLMSVYHADSEEYLNLAIKSIIDQTLPPNEIVLVKDGPIGQELEQVIDKWANRHPNLFAIVALPVNKGLGSALNAGLKECTYDIIARMDADDISYPHRFEKQLQYLADHPDIVLVSSWMACFGDNPSKILHIRQAPTTHDKIYKLAKFRNPINHAPSVFRRRAVIEVGGYKHWPGFEDYHLFVRMLINNAKMACIGEPLYKVRLEGMYARRRGLKRIGTIMNLQKEFLKMGFISPGQAVYNVIVRTIACIMPVRLARLIRIKILKL
jgi:glycosyltransferase involved in cell wall biosynthesis